MNELLSTQQKPQEQLLFPQDFRAGEASPEELTQHLDFANWTIKALEDAIALANEEDVSRIKNQRDATGGVRIVLQQRIDDTKR